MDKLALELDYFGGHFSVIPYFSPLVVVSFQCGNAGVIKKNYLSSLQPV
jgi:hypothetical protein